MHTADASNVLRLAGEIDLHVSPEIALRLQRLLATRPPRVVVDLSAVNYIDSSGLAVLIGAANDAEEYGGRLMLSGVHDAVEVIIETAGLSRFFTAFPHVDAALAAT